MEKSFIIASTGDRKNGLKTLLISLIPYILNGWKVYAVCQGYSEADLSEIKGFIQRGKVFSYPDLIGAHTAKMIALTNGKSDIWCSLDDDMIATSKTDYNKIADILSKDNRIGFISGNWVRSEKQIDKKDVVDSLVKQKLVFTGGGLLFRDDVAEIVRNIPNEQYLFDDCLWAMYAYINGYENYRYRGSVAIHQICTKGGRRTWIAKTDGKVRVLPPDNLLRVRKGSAQSGYNEYLICNDSDLTEEAHRLHKARLKTNV